LRLLAAIQAHLYLTKKPIGARVNRKPLPSGSFRPAGNFIPSFSVYKRYPHTYRSVPYNTKENHRNTQIGLQGYFFQPPAETKGLWT